MNNESAHSTAPNIMVVDDTKENLQFLVHALSAEGFKVRPAPSGKLALEGALRHRPDVVLLDITMPEMDGYEVCARMKAIEDLAGVPILFISALNEPFDKVRAFDAGGADYVTKPFQIEEVLARIRLQLNLVALQRQKDALILELQEALEEVKTLRSFIPICAHCKKVREDGGFWEAIESYVGKHAGLEFSHSICPSCAKEHFNIEPEAFEGL